jgi:NADPH:quinone reductase
MVKSVLINEFGSSEVMQIKNIKLPSLKDGEIKIKNEASGINYIDIDIRKGLYQDIKPTCGIGFEGAGKIIEICGDVGNLKIGDHVAYFSGKINYSGAYAEERILHHSLIYPIPEGITSKQAAAILFKGMAAHYLTIRAHVITPESIALVYAAAGGLGMILTQYIKHLGGKVIGVVGHEQKEQIAKNNGCDFVINSNKDDIFKKIVEYTNNQGVTVVYDGIGKDTINESIKCIRPFGLMANIGHCSGVIENLNIDLIRNNNIFFTSTNIFKYKENRMEALLTANELFDFLQKGIIKDNINLTYSLEDIKNAHNDIENRLTVGSNIIIY